MVKKSSLPENVTGEDLAYLLDVDQRTIRNYAAAGTITKPGPNIYPLAESIRGIIAAAKKSSRNSALEKEQAALMAGKRKMIELRLAEEERRLIEMSEAEAVLDEIVGTFRAGLDSLGPRISRDPELRRKVKVETDAILQAASDKFAQLAKQSSYNEKDNDDAE